MSKCTGTLRDEYGSIRLSILKARIKNLSPEELKNDLENTISLLKEKYSYSPSDREFYENVDETLRKFNYSDIATFLLDNSHKIDLSDIGNADDAIKQQYYNTSIKELSSEGVDISELDITNLNKHSDLLRIFNNNVDSMQMFINKFNSDIFETILFSNTEDAEKIRFASTNNELNDNIIKWKNKIPYSGYNLTLKLENEILKYSNSNEVVNALLSSKNTDLYNMFIKKHFDKLLILSDNRIISTTNDPKHPYKFSIQSNMRNRWTDNEFVSFFDEIGSFSRTILETRKAIKLTKENGKFVFDLADSYVKLDQMFYSVNKLHSFIDRTNPVQSFTKAIEDVLTKKLVKKSADSYLQNISNDDLCVYLGLYVNFLNKDNSILEKSKYKVSDYVKNIPNFYKASKNTFELNTSSNKLDYFDVVIANIVKQTGNTYTQSIYDYDTKEFNIETLNSAKINRAKYQLVNSIEFKINNLNFDSIIENLDLEYDYNNNSPIISYNNISIDLNNNSFEIEGELSSDTRKKIFDLIHTFIPYSPSINLNSYQNYLDLTESKENAIESLLPVAIRSMFLLKNKDSIEISLEKDNGISNINNVFKGITRYTQFINHETGGDVKSVIMSAKDTALPSYGLINMINEPRTMISYINKGIKNVDKFISSRKRKRPNVLRNNFIISNNKDLKKANINTFLVFGESVNAVNKSYHQDVFYNNFVLQYLKNINNSKYDLVVQPTTFSDKNKQTSVVFDARNTTALWNNEQILNSLRENTTKYYDNQIEIVKDDLLDVIETFGIDVSNIKTLNDIESILGEMKSQGISMQDIYQHAQDINIELVDQLHFEKAFKLNSALKLIEEHDSKITNGDLNSKLYNKLIDFQLKSFISQLEEDGIIINMNISSLAFQDYISRVGKFIGYKDYDSYYKDWVDEKTDRLILRKENVINPILYRYFLERALIAESYQHITVGNELAHKAKGAYSLKDTDGDYVKALSSNMSMRYVAMTKRAVAHQATMHPYQLGLFNGVPYYENICFIVDPEMTLFNQLGNKTSQPVTDGASFSNMLSTILKNNSLLDQGGQIHHKSIGMSIDPYNGSAKLMKHADHNISNEKIRNSMFAKYNLNRLIKKMLDIPFLYDIDLTKDFNNKNIFRSLIPVRYKTNDGTIYEVKSFEKIKGLKNAYLVNNVETEINSLYDLWKVLGGEYSINEKNVYDDSSWYNLAEFVNRVGFYKNKEDMANFISNNNIEYESIRSLLNNTRYDDDNTIEYTRDKYRPTSDSIFQPLKYNFISQATFTSAFKVGPSNINSTDVLENENPLRAVKWASIYTGLQLDHEHHTDDSDLSEPTQLISSIFFNGDAYEWNKQISTSVKQYIINNIKNFFQSNFDSIPYDVLSNKINSYINQELSKKDLSGFAINASKKITKEINDIVSKKRKALKKNDIEEFNNINIDVDESLPLSDSSIYNVIINSINNLFTSLGIRRKLSGSANVQSPQTDFITVHNINGKIKPAGTLTPEDIEIINTEIDLTNTPDQIQPFDVVDLYIDDKKIYSNYHLTDFDVYQKILYGEFDKVVLKPHAGRDLNPTMTTFDAVYNKEDENGNIETIIIPNRNFYDTDAGTILIDATNLSEPISTKEPLEIIDRKAKLNNLLYRYNSLMSRYNQVYDRDDSGLDSIQKAILLAIENPEIGLQLNKKQKNVLKNLQLKTYNDLKHGIYYTTSIDINYGFDLGTKIGISNYKEIPSEVMIPSHMQSKFLIDDNVDISDINENYYINKIRNIVLDAITNTGKPKSIHTIIEANGEHVYCMPEEWLPEKAKLIESYSGTIDDKSLLNRDNKPIANIGTAKLYELENNGKKFKIATYKDVNDVYKIEESNDNIHRYIMTYISGENELNSNKVIRLSKSMANNFQASLYGAMARIPGQSKQSGMAFKNVGFIKTERNAAYTSPYFLWLAGADFDIDKVNQILFSFDEKGEIYKFTSYHRDDNPDFILESMSLPVPDGVDKFNPNSEYAIELSNEDIDLLRNIRNCGLDDFQKISLLLHKISNKGYKISEENKEIKDILYSYFVNDSKDQRYTKPQSYENAIVGSFFHGLKDGRNLIHAYAPMDDDTIKKIAKKSPKGAKDHKMNHLNPYTDVNGMIVNSVGKDGIAIVAVGLKAFAAITDRLNQMKNGDIENLKLKSDLAIQIDNVIGEKGSDTILMPNGFDLKNMQDIVGRYLDKNFSNDLFNSQEDYQVFKDKYLNLLIEDGDNSLMLSQLMTLATDQDNAVSKDIFTEKNK